MRILAVKIKPSSALADAKISRVKYCMYFRSLDWEHHRKCAFCLCFYDNDNNDNNNPIRITSGDMGVRDRNAEAGVPGDLESV